MEIHQKDRPIPIFRSQLIAMSNFDQGTDKNNTQLCLVEYCCKAQENTYILQLMCILRWYLLLLWCHVVTKKNIHFLPIQWSVLGGGPAKDNKKGGLWGFLGNVWKIGLAENAISWSKKELDTDLFNWSCEPAASNGSNQISKFAFWGAQKWAQEYGKVPKLCPAAFGS